MCIRDRLYRAPKEKDNSKEYRLLCLNHVKEFNKSWNYFSGMSDDQVINFLKSDITWHKPTQSFSSSDNFFKVLWNNALKDELKNSNIDPNFEYYKPIAGSSKLTVTVGGISEESQEWSGNTLYERGMIVQYKNEFYRAARQFTSGTTFTIDGFAKLEELPITGGRTAFFYKDFDATEVHKLQYGTKLNNTQEVVDFMLGYNARQKELGFTFNEVDSFNEKVENCLNLLTKAAENSENIMPYILDAVREYCTIGEMTHALEQVHGRYKGSI